jgi:hypothetical protein
MTIRDHKASTVYQYAKSDHPWVNNTKLQVVAEAADDMAEDLHKNNLFYSSWHNLKPFKDDPMYNLEVQIFRTLAENNGVDIEAAYEVAALGD